MADIGHNSQLTEDQKTEFKKLHQMIGAEKDLASSANARANAHRKAIKAMSIDLSAYAAAAKRDAMETDKRVNFDQSYASVCESLGIPMQSDLFGGTDDEDDATAAGGE